MAQSSRKPTVYWERGDEARLTALPAGQHSVTVRIDSQGYIDRRDEVACYLLTGTKAEIKRQAIAYAKENARRAGGRMVATISVTR